MYQNKTANALGERIDTRLRSTGQRIETDVRVAAMTTRAFLRELARQLFISAVTLALLALIAALFFQWVTTYGS